MHVQLKHKKIIVRTICTFLFFLTGARRALWCDAPAKNLPKITNITFAQFVQVDTNSHTQKSTLSLNTKRSLFRATLQLVPTQKCTSIGFKTSISPTFNLYAGSIKTSGVFTRAKSPHFSVPKPTSAPTSPSLLFGISLPSLSTSENTDFGIALEQFKNGYQFFAYARLCTINLDDDLEEDDDGTSAEKKVLQIYNNGKMLFRKNAKDNLNFSSFVPQLCFGLRHKASNNWSWAFALATEQKEHKQSNNWFLEEAPLPTHTVATTIAELAYNTPKKSFFASQTTSISPYKAPSGTIRLEANFFARNASLQGAFFAADLHHNTLENSTMRKTLSAYIAPRIFFNFGKDNANTITLGANFQINQSFSAQFKKTRTRAGAVRFCAQYESKNTSVNFDYSLKNINLDEALNGAISNCMDNFENANNFLRSKIFDANLFGTNSYNAVRENNATSTKKQSAHVEISVSTNKVFMGKKQTLLFNAEYDYVPKNKDAQSKLKLGAKNVFCIGTLFTINTEFYNTYTLDAPVANCTGASATTSENAKNFILRHVSSSLKRDVNLYKMQFSQTIKFNLPATRLVPYKKTFTIKETFSVDLSKQKNTIVFYCGYALYIKP